LSDEALRTAKVIALVRALDVRQAGDGEPASCDVDVLDAVGLRKGRAMIGDFGAPSLVAGHLYVVALVANSIPQAVHSLALWKALEVPSDHGKDAFHANTDRRKALTQ
jgi:hypothetical protein